MTGVGELLAGHRRVAPPSIEGLLGTAPRRRPDHVLDSAFTTGGVALAGVLLIVAGQHGRAWLALAWFGVQVVLVGAALLVARVPARLGSATIAVGALAAADLLVAVPDEPAVGGLATVLAGVFFAGLIQHTARTDRSGVTEALATTLALVAFGLGGALHVATLAQRGGEPAVTVATLSVGVALTVVAGSTLLGDRWWIAPAGAVGGLAIAAVAALTYAGGAAPLTRGDAWVVGVLPAAVAVGLSVGVNAAIGSGRGWPGTVLRWAFPLLMAMPVAYVAARITLA